MTWFFSKAIWIISSIIFGVCCYGLGWYAKHAKYEREKKAEEFLTACGVYDEKPDSAKDKKKFI